MDRYYYIPISKTIFTICLVITILFTIISLGTLLILLIIPLIYYFILKNCKYYYNDDKMIIETGVLNKQQKVVPLYRIINITAQDNIFNYGTIYIKDKEQMIILKYVQNSRNEMLKLTENWEKSKNRNIRNEVI